MPDKKEGRENGEYDELFADRYGDKDAEYAKPEPEPICISPWYPTRGRGGPSSGERPQRGGFNPGTPVAHGTPRPTLNRSGGPTCPSTPVQFNTPRAPPPTPRTARQTSTSSDEVVMADNGSNGSSANGGCGTSGAAKRANANGGGGQERRSKEISQAEKELYDRQIRLWGLEAQNRLRNSNVLLVGLSGLGAEVAKNLMLSGLRSLTLMDDKNVSPDDHSSQFLIPPNSHAQNRAEASKQRAQVLNPMVELIALPESLDAQTDDFVRSFQLVILVDQPYTLINRVDKLCRKHGVMFLAGCVYGWTGFAFFDFNNQLFLLPKPKEHALAELSDDDDNAAADGESGEPVTKRARPNPPSTSAAPVITLETDEDAKIQQAVPFASFEAAFNVDWSSKKNRRARFASSITPVSYFPIRALLRLHNEKDAPTFEGLAEQYKRELESARVQEGDPVVGEADLEFMTGPQLSPVCAIVGSVMGQEAIKALSQNDTPLKNIFLYSAIDTSGIVCNYPPGT